MADETTNIFTRLGTAFSTWGGAKNTKPDALTRFMGGHNKTLHPFVNGYWQFLCFPPEGIFDKAGITQHAQNWLFTAAEGFTPPSRSLNLGDVPGQGGVDSSFVTRQTLNRTFTVTFREQTGMPLMNIFELWTSVLDPYVGVSPISGANWGANQYKGSCFVILTKPTGAFSNTALTSDDLEEVYFFSGIIPQGPPHDALTSDIAGSDFTQYNITFSFDGWPLTRQTTDVVSRAVDAINTVNYINNTYTGSFISALNGTPQTLSTSGDTSTGGSTTSTT